MNTYPRIITGYRTAALIIFVRVLRIFCIKGMNFLVRYQIYCGVTSIASIMAIICTISVVALLSHLV